MGVCYCSCGHSSKSHVFPNSYVQECKKFYDKTIKEVEFCEKMSDTDSSPIRQLEWARQAREWKKWAQEYLNILKQIE